MLGLHPDDTPASIVDAINNYAGSARTTGQQPETADIISIGALLGFQYVRQFGWDWFELDYGNGESAFAVLNSGHSLGNQPLNWAYGVLVERTEINFLLNFNMVATGSVPTGTTGDPTMFN